jgi:hypothetical protein
MCKLFDYLIDRAIMLELFHIKFPIKESIEMCCSNHIFMINSSTNLLTVIIIFFGLFCLYRSEMVRSRYDYNVRSRFAGDRSDEMGNFFAYLKKASIFGPRSLQLNAKHLFIPLKGKPNTSHRTIKKPLVCVRKSPT